MRTRPVLFAVAVALGVACRPQTTVVTVAIAPPQRAATAAPEGSEPPISSGSLSELIGGLALVSPGSTSVEIEGMDTVCEAAGFPETLSAEAAADLEAAAPGASITTVHVDGQTTRKVVAAGCSEPGDFEPASTNLEVVGPVGPSPPGATDIQRMLSAPFMAFVGAAPDPGARLRLPPAVDPGSELGRDVLALSRTFALDFAQARYAQCIDEDGATAVAESGVQAPTEGRIEAAVLRAEMLVVTSAKERVVFVTYSDPALTFECYGADDPALVGVLFDVDAGKILEQHETNNELTPQWVVDLDGDGNEELLLDLMWLEDSGHSILLLYRGADGWTESTIYAFDGP
jgi:hypothetical protein